MQTKLSSALAAALFLVASSFAALIARSQDAPSLADQLKSQYKLAKVGVDSSGWSITQPGTVLVIQKGGILGVPLANPTIATATFKDGELHGPNAFTIAIVGKVTRQLAIGEKIYIAKIDVQLKNDKIGFFLIECDACNNVQEPSSYKAMLVFQFPKGYLDKADSGQVLDVINQVLAPDADAGSSDQQQAPQQQAPQQQESPQATASVDTVPPPAMATIQLGETIDQVKAALGQPEKIVDLGKKQIYVYKDLKITFLDGKVFDVQ
jgi:hypothetical protein